MSCPKPLTYGQTFIIGIVFVPNYTHLENSGNAKCALPVKRPALTGQNPSESALLNETLS
jgi:hypothetical protein